MQSESEIRNGDSLMGVAIVSMAGRFPGARNIEKFWYNLRNGVESVITLSDDELLAAGEDAPIFQDPRYVRRVAIIEEPELFDASFFGFTPREAELMDPQHRLFLECAWEALESAGYDPEQYAGRIGVYAGASANTYLLNLYSHPTILRSFGGMQTKIANEKDHLTTIVSYKLNLKGPGVTIQTACSTSLVAIHVACQSLLNGECDMALAGGVGVSGRPKIGYLHQEGSPLSADGYCRAFDADANGLVSGSGVGIVLLKRLEDAVADGDQIHAVIRGSAINNDGSQKIGYTAPSVVGQVRVIAEAQAVADVDPATISYVEAHGTGTPLGDPIEIAALRKAFSSRTSEKAFCAIGSVKTNIGHLDAAAGVAGLIKATLAIENGEIPPSLNYKRPNPEINFADGPFYVSTKLHKWETRDHPRRAGVSSFGVGGTNAHVVLEEAPVAESSDESRSWQLLTLSAKTASALENASANLLGHCRAHPELNLADAAYTLKVGRRHFDHRAFVVCRDLDEATTALETGQALTAYRKPCEWSVVFMFPGGGAQYANMGLDLYREEPTYREHVDACLELLTPMLGFDLRTILFPVPERFEEATKKLRKTSVALPALFVTEYALARLWMSWGVEPQALIGHSLGEYVAACLAGVFSLEDALALIIRRGRLLERLPNGSMLSVFLPEDEVRALLNERLSVAAINAPALCVVSGITEAIEELAKTLTERDVDCHRLMIDAAAHSEMLEPVLNEFTAFVKTVSLNVPNIPYVSNVTGSWINAEEATDPLYWARHLRQTVRLSDGIGELLRQPNRLLLEVGPGATLSLLANMQAQEIGAHASLTSMRHAHDTQSDSAFLLTTLGKLWQGGVTIDWTRFYEGERRRRVSLPTYPFERQRYWIEFNSRQTEPPRSLERQADVADWFYLPVWKQSLAHAPVEIGDLDPSSCWLVFEDSCGLGRKIVERLRIAGHRVFTVTVGEAFARRNDGAYHIDHRDPSDYVKLLSDLRARGVTPDRVAHLWSLTEGEPPAAGREFFSEVQSKGFYSLLFLAQALIKEGLEQSPSKSGPGRPLQLQVISNNVHRVTGEERLWPEKATILGPCKSIPQEYPGISCLSIDLTLPEAAVWQETRLLDNLVLELTANASNRLVAYRGADRWVQTFEPIKLEAGRRSPLRLRERGVYLLTGGLGKDSLIRARYLAQEVRARLVLVGRTGLPDETEWEYWFETHGEQDGVSIKIRQVQDLLRLGAEVLIVKTDVADEAQMRSVMKQVDERFGELHGVIHAAGITEASASRLINELSNADCELQFQPKVYGLYVLEKILQGRKLDFCILTSSIASVIGGVGLLAYTSANIFMDAFAHRHNQIDSVSWLSLNWQGCTPEETIEAFKSILSMPPTSQVVVSTRDLKARIARRINLNFLRSSERPAESAQARPNNLRNAYVGPSSEIEQTITDIWRDLLGITWLGVHDSFLEVGGNSLLAVQLISRLNRTFEIELPLRILFEAPTIAGLAASIERLRTLPSSRDDQHESNTNRANYTTLNQEEASSANSLVAIQTGGSLEPFFCVHPSGGNVFCFLQLAHQLGYDQPFYAFQSRGLHAGESSHTRVEEMAAYYIQALRTVRPSGPYLLGGWSMGGLVAFEMAQQLQGQGEDIRLLALLDTRANYNRKPAEEAQGEQLINFAKEVALSWGLETKWDDLQLEWDDLSLLKSDEQLDRVLARAKELGAIPADLGLFDGRRLLEVFSANAEAMHRYVPQTYAGRLTVIRTNDHRGEMAQDPTLGWGRLATRGVDSYVVGGTHYTMIRNPFLEEVTKALAVCLKLAQEEP